MADDKATHDKAPHHGGAHHAAPAKKAATRQILRDVVFHDRTFKPGDEDDLERRLTAESAERLKGEDPPVIAGEWSPGGEEVAPMLRSPLGDAPAGNRALQARSKAPAGPGKTHPAVAEAERLREENKRLKAEAEKAKGGGK